MESPRVVVVGAGPAGLMAAERLAAGLAGVPGATVTVVDHMASAGRKLLVAGRGGLNLTHTEPLDRFLDRYGPARPRLEAAVRAFGPDQLRDWSAGLGQPTFVGSSDRVFPESFRATDLLGAWLARLRSAGVVFHFGVHWRGWDGDTPVFAGSDGAPMDLPADVTVLALGGATWPRTGSDGAWVAPVERAGVRVAPLRPSNCGFVVAWSEHVAGRFAGQPLKNVELRFGDVTVRGEAMVTDDGIEGNAVYALSAPLRDAVERDGSAELVVNLRPDLTDDALAARLGARRPKESTARWLRRAAGLQPVAIALLREPPGPLPVEPEALARRITACPLRVEGVQPLDRAISTAGGIAFDDVDDDFMLVRRPGTFVAGEMLDWEAPTGGYLLQATFATAVAAARGALRFLGVAGD